MKLITQNLTPADFFANGGTIEYEVDANEVDETNPKFYELPTIKPKLHTGFELPPSTVIHEPNTAHLITAAGNNWTRFIAKIYRMNGKIIYTQITQDLYRAVCTI
ncbi:hypothetical protein [Enterobacter hormaechei]|uniref:hypothetical protein n=1 Tax=Enterobacter cloacae complex TaxID=354276 RepID=UPI00067F6C1C|nr:hypothetical protein [Enterobacter hormaechei]